MGSAVTTWAQTDVTSTYITNAGFDESSVFQTGNISTGSNGRKAVTGWSNTGSGSYNAGGAIGFNTSGQINGKSLPSTNADGGTSGGALTISNGWGSSTFYSQNVTLPAGNYTFKFQVYNLGTNGNWNNEATIFSFEANGYAYNNTSRSFGSSWTEASINVALAEETTGTIKIGYKDSNKSSSETPKLVIDYVKAFYNSNYTTTLESAIDRATKLYSRIADSDLHDAIEVAQNVVDGATNAIAYQSTIDNAVTTLNSAIAEARAKVVLEGEEDITYLLENSNFEIGNSATVGVCTYDYDCSKNGTFYSRMQYVEGWEAVGNANGKAAGVINYGSSVWISGSSYPATSVTSSIGESKALALVAAWSASVQYKQSVTLPAGVYALTVPVFNSNGATAITKNLIGFITDGGTEYLATTTAYPVGSTKTETINFTLEEETSGYISLGYTAANTGSGNCPKMFIDAITIKYFTADKSALFDKLKEAQDYQDVLANSDLATAISTAQGVYDDPQSLQSAVDAQVEALNTAIATALANIANGTNVTALFIKDNSFEEGGTPWEFNSASDTGVKDNGNAQYTTYGVDGTKLFNTWGGSTDKYVKQTLEDLPNGYYVVSALVASDYPLTVTLYAGDGINSVEADYTGKESFISGVSGIGIPSEGSLEIGITSTNWYKADKFQLIYYTTEDNAQNAIEAANLAHAVTTYNKALTTAKATSNVVITGKEKADLDAAIAADGELDKDVIADVISATEALYSAITTFTASATVSAYERAAYAITKATDASVDCSALSTLKSASTTLAADLTDPTNELLAEVINSYSPGTFGFEDGQYAPYNNIEGLKSLAIADDIASKTTDEIDETITLISNGETWTVNDGDVDAIYNGTFSETGTGNNPKGWTRSNNGWGQQITGLTAVANGVDTGTTTAWYYNNNGAWKYGNDGVYTMPLAASTTYVLKFKYRKNGSDWQTWMKASVLNADEEGLSVVQYPGANDGTTFEAAEAYFTTGAAGNYILSIENNGNAHLTDVSLVKVASTTKTLAESTTFSMTPKYSFADVQLTRNFSAGVWNTFVVPFDIDNATLTSVFGGEVKVAEATLASTSVSFNTMETPAITANKPVIIKGVSETGPYNFNGVLLKNATPTINNEGTSFVGNYGAEITLEDGVYYIASNKLKLANGTQKLKGFRAYFTTTSEARLSMFLDDEETTGIEGLNVKDTQLEGEVYNLNGMKMTEGSKLQKGIYVKNGKKVVIK